ncbi:MULTISPECIES: DNA replication terminus site-binding protein [Lonsdalea]|uniref:DNA replication terminus site-binding protein n=2 Tax=Lonsdalea TaxID=1082702 RepID=A0ACD1JAY7_9GAMM|nr:MULTISPECIES: DNA replication terminus site-binding protein [Lonsdalea]OSM99613.1 DNA replication terminus site-binding protein [Lonsdalea populi]RAT12825.1 DNA replication terminus site-binding protein [Lonsdalea quercina]RAT22256.1 DNA replication terminus site-binding protein [Lonsdalea populi]RAT24987.1 DNA replication terminus site-binding protein [Lonsdalea populi]RAT25142.1 DNA replication terminus site-binding protein [Lonsdalea populi]
MAAYDVIERMNQTFIELEKELRQMQQQFSQLDLVAARVFTLPEIEKGCEHDPIMQIAVTPSEGEAARDLALQHFQRLFIHHYAENISSKAAIRLPGALCFSVDETQILEAEQRIVHINTLKKTLEYIITVESGLEPEQRFDFVHTHLRGLITLSAYRTIPMIVNPASVRFGWANKNIIKKVTRDDVLKKLEKSLQAGRSLAPYGKEQWALLMEQEIFDVKRLPEQALLKIKRPVKVQPIARVWYQEQQKQVQYPCPSPLIVLCRLSNGASAPVLGELNDYDAGSIKHKHKPKAHPLRLLIPRLHLYTDEGA